MAAAASSPSSARLSARNRSRPNVIAEAEANKSSNGSNGKKDSTSSMDSTSSLDSGLRDLVPAGLVRPGQSLPAIHPKYTKVGESFRKNVPHEIQCSMFCGGRKCKYEISEHWKPDEMAIKGVFSHWITDNLLAMARPNRERIRETIAEFQSHGIRSIINLQTPGEHASCGPKLHAESGFTYDPKDFMDANVFFYNFGWKDYREASMPTLLDMVKVLSFALSEGKVAVHCHAGLGRTGVLLACYLVYFLRVRANDALRYVRLKRPNAVQTRRQIDCVKEFEAFFLPQCLIFSLKPKNDPDKKTAPFGVEQHLKRQRMVIHGYEARVLKHIPKVIFRICERLIKLCGGSPPYDVDEGDFTKNFVAFKLDSKGNKLLNYKAESSSSLLSTPSDSITATRRSSRSMMAMSTDDEIGSSAGSSAVNVGGGGGGARPGSETDSYAIQSCSSALSGVKSIDGYLDDGIRNQALADNPVTKEMVSHADKQEAARNEVLPKYTAAQIYSALMDTHGKTMANNKSNPAFSKAPWTYRVDLNFRLSAWDAIDTETDLFVLTSLLFEWMEHLRRPILDKEGITYLVIHCDDVEAALRKLPNHMCYVLEYLVRFVARLRPLPRQQSRHLLSRIMASMTHQSIAINGVVYPSGKRESEFPKLRGGTAESTMKFMLRLFAIVAEPAAAANNEGATVQDRLNRLKEMEGDGFNSLDVSAVSTKSVKQPQQQPPPQQQPQSPDDSMEDDDAGPSSSLVRATVHNSVGGGRMTSNDDDDKMETAVAAAATAAAADNNSEDRLFEDELRILSATTVRQLPS